MPKQILLVDDSVTIQRVVRAHLRARDDYKVTAAKSVDEGLQKARELKPDIVLADAGMTRQDRLRSVRRVAQRRRAGAVPVPDPDGQFRALRRGARHKAGADGYVVKPFETQALIDKVADAINRKGARPAAAASAPPIVATTAWTQGRQSRDSDRRRQVGADAGAGRAGRFRRRRPRRRLRPRSSRRRRRRPRAR